MGKFKVLSGGGWFWIGVAGQRDPKRRTSALVGYKNALGFSVLDGWTSGRVSGSDRRYIAQKSSGSQA